MNPILIRSGRKAPSRTAGHRATAGPDGPHEVRSPIPVPPLSRPVPRRRTPKEG